MSSTARGSRWGSSVSRDCGEVDLAGRDPAAEVRFRVVANDDGDPGVPDSPECRDANNTADATGACTIVF